MGDRGCFDDDGYAALEQHWREDPFESTKTTGVSFNHPSHQVNPITDVPFVLSVLSGVVRTVLYGESTLYCTVREPLHYVLYEVDKTSKFVIFSCCVQCYFFGLFNKTSHHTQDSPSSHNSSHLSSLTKIPTIVFPYIPARTQDSNENEEIKAVGRN